MDAPSSDNKLQLFSTTVWEINSSEWQGKDFKSRWKWSRKPAGGDLLSTSPLHLREAAELQVSAQQGLKMLSWQTITTSVNMINIWKHKSDVSIKCPVLSDTPSLHTTRVFLNASANENGKRPSIRRVRHYNYWFLSEAILLHLCPVFHFPSGQKRMNYLCKIRVVFAASSL